MARKNEAVRREKEFERRRKRLKKLTERAAVSYEGERAILTFSNGQVFKCAGPLSDFIFRRGAE